MKRAWFSAWRAAAGLARPSAAGNLRRFRARRESVNSFAIREAIAADIPALAELHVTTWNATHASLLLKGPSVAIREQQWRDAFAKNDPHWFCFVVERPGGQLIGFAQARASDHPEFRGQLDKIYLLREYQRVGLGKRLMGRVARKFLGLGITSMWLFGDPRNPSCRAWVALGGEKTDNDPGTGNYGWRDIAKLAELESA